MKYSLCMGLSVTGCWKDVGDAVGLILTWRLLLLKHALLVSPQSAVRQILLSSLRSSHICDPFRSHFGSVHYRGSPASSRPTYRQYEIFDRTCADERVQEWSLRRLGAARRNSISAAELTPSGAQTRRQEHYYSHVGVMADQTASVVTTHARADRPAVGAQMNLSSPLAAPRSCRSDVLRDETGA